MGFILGDVGDSWLGGINYYRNLLSALNLLRDRRLQPVVFVGTEAAESFAKKFNNVEIVRSQIFNIHAPAGILGRALNKLFGNDSVLLRPVLKRNRIDVLSHFGPLPSGSMTKTIGWIPDFQHLHLTDFFNKNEIERRNAAFMKISRGCDRVIVSSQSALHDLANFSTTAATNARVLRFVPEILATEVPIADLEQKYKFHRPYFHLPNQFWVHKNHKVVIEALAELETRGIHPIVLATGKEYDYRHPKHFSDLMARVNSLGLSQRFKSLGVIPYEDMLSLMRYSIAVINPSLFEGWSSTIEEAKALGKKVLLSDLVVHREQDPERGIFFSPTDPRGLARAMWACLNDYVPGEVGAGGEADGAAHFLNRIRFAQEYQDIVVELFDSAN